MEPADYAEGAMVEDEIKSIFDSMSEDYMQLGLEMPAPLRIV